MGAGVGREVCHVAAEHERLARNDRTSLIRPSACRIGYMARRETRNKNPALTLFLKLLRELYPLLSPVARCRTLAPNVGTNECSGAGQHKFTGAATLYLP